MKDNDSNGNHPVNQNTNSGREHLNNGYKPPSNQSRPAPASKPPPSNNK